MAPVWLLIDTDAFICLRRFKLLELLRSSNQIDLVMTEYAARHELCDLQQDVAELEGQGKLRVEAVKARTDAYKVFRKLISKGADKGEAEAIAWAAQQLDDDPPLFVSLDNAARKHATKHRLEAVDVMDLVVDLVEQGVLRRVDVHDRLVVWEDVAAQFCRPADFTTFDETFERRRQSRSTSRGGPP